MRKRIINIVVWALIAAWFFVVTGFVNRSNESLLCHEIIIDISDSLEHSFITADEVRSILQPADTNLQGYPVDQINTRELEKLLEQNPYVSNAEVYTDINGDLYADVMQRTPLIRVMPGGEQGYYIDGDQMILPLSDQYTPNVLLVNGNIHFETLDEENGVSRVDVSHDQELKALLQFAASVKEDPFWSRQIVQVYRAENGDFEIIPRVGAHQIVFGSMKDYPEKLRNLYLLYKQGFEKYGWNTYEKISLKYSNQIICTKR